MSKKIVPVGKKILIKQDDPEETYGSTSIYVPDSHKISDYAGIVVAVGNDVMEIKEGDHVQYAEHSVPVEMTHGGEEHLLISQADILAIIVDV